MTTWTMNKCMRRFSTDWSAGPLLAIWQGEGFNQHPFFNYLTKKRNVRQTQHGQSVRKGGFYRTPRTLPSDGPGQAAVGLITHGDTGDLQYPFMSTSGPVVLFMGNEVTWSPSHLLHVSVYWPVVLHTAPHRPTVSTPHRFQTAAAEIMGYTHIAAWNGIQRWDSYFRSTCKHHRSTLGMTQVLL